MPTVSIFDFASHARQLLTELNARKYWSVAGYLAAFAAISSAIYYLPNYSWLEYWTAVHSETVLRLLGMSATITVTPGGTLLNEFLVDKPCTGIQVVATFAGILLPLPRLPWFKKLAGITLVVVGVYIANIARIAIQLWVYYKGLFDWTTIHGPGGIALGIISVTVLVVLLDQLVPEFGDFVFSILKR